MTVSRAVNSPDQMPASTLEKVRLAIARTGYVPNQIAGGLRSSRSRLVSMVVPTIAGSVFLETIQSLTASLAARGYSMMLGQSGYAPSFEDELLRAIIGRRPDGIVIAGVMHSPESQKLLISSGIPVVETWDLTPKPIDMLVGFSHKRVGGAVCRYLFDSGRRRLALIGGNDERSRRRATAFVTMAKRLGMADVVLRFVPAPTTVASGRSAIAEILQTAKVDAVFCSSDLLALGVLIEARAAHIRVPGQLAVVGFGDVAFAADLDPPLTSVRIDGMRIGRDAARCIMERIDGTGPARSRIDVGFTIVQRATA